MSPQTREEVIEFLRDGECIIVERVNPKLIKVGTTVEAVVTQRGWRGQPVRLTMNLTEIGPAMYGQQPLLTVKVYTATMFDGDITVSGEFRERPWHGCYGELSLRAVRGG